MTPAASQPLPQSEPTTVIVCSGFSSPLPSAWESCRRCARAWARSPAKVLSDLIRERFGVRWTAFVMLALLIANGGVTVSEFVGIAAAIGIVWRRALHLCPDRSGRHLVAGRQGIVPTSRARVSRHVAGLSWLHRVGFSGPSALGHRRSRSWCVRISNLTPAYLFTFVAVVGTTISPYMQVFIQSSVVEKGVRPENYRFTKHRRLGRNRVRNSGGLLHRGFDRRHLARPRRTC